MAKQHYREAPSEKEKKVFAKFLSEDEELVLATGVGNAYLRSRFMVGLIIPGIIFIFAGLGVANWLGFNLGIGLLIGFILACFSGYLKAVYTYHANRYLLTTRRVVIKKGLMAVQLTSALYDKVTHIEVDQSFFDKVFMHHGTIIINTAGMNKGEIILSFIDYPVEFKNLLERMINREREQFGLRAGPVVTLEGEVV